jgi:hypothetical protein
MNRSYVVTTTSSNVTQPLKTSVGRQLILNGKKEMNEQIESLSNEFQVIRKQSNRKSMNESLVDLLNNLHEEDEKIKNTKERNSILDHAFLANNIRQGSRFGTGKKRNKNRTKSKKHNSQNSFKNNSATNISVSFEHANPQSNVSFYLKEKERIQRKNFNLEIKRNEKIYLEKELVREKPELSKNTQKIISDRRMNDEKPIYLRTQEVLLKKEIDLQTLKKRYEEQNELENNDSYIMHQNTRAISATMKTQSNQNNMDRVLTWVEQQTRWQKNKQEKLIRTKNDIRKLDSETDNIFKPHINKTSQNLAKMKNQNNINISIHDKLYNEKNELKDNHEKLLQEYALPFHPTTNKINKVPIALYTGTCQSTLTNMIPTITNYDIEEESPSNLIEIRNNRLLKIGKNRTRNKSMTEVPNGLTSAKSIIMKGQQEKFIIKNTSNLSNLSSLNRTIRKEQRNSSNPNFSFSPDTNKKREKRWQEEINDINKHYHGAKKNAYEQKDFLYKLNIRPSSAWYKDKENSIIVSKRDSLIKTLLKN